MQEAAGARPPRAERAIRALARFVGRHRRAVVAAWVVLLLASLWPSSHQTTRLTDGGWEVPGSASEIANQRLATFPNIGSVRLAVFVEGDAPRTARAALARARTRAAEVALVQPGALRSLGPRQFLLPLIYHGSTDKRVEVATQLRRAVVSNADGASVRVVGTPAVWSNFSEVSKRQLARAEMLGFPLILIVLLAAFGTVVASLAPLLLGMVCVVVTGAVVYLLAGAIDMSVYVTNVASMIGIGVAVDYSLFVVSRYRRELHDGRSVEEAGQRAMASAGTAAVFSGATVVISLASMLVIDINAVRSIAIGAMIVVSIAVLATATLLPALLVIAGRRIDRLPVRRPGRRQDSREFWERWTSRVMRRPGRALIGGAAVLLLLAAPALALRTENHGLEQLPRDAEVRRAMDRVAQLAGPGALAPISVVTSDRVTAQRIATRLRRVPGIASATPPIAAPDRSRFLVEAVQTDDAESDAGRATYRRASAVAQAIAPRGVEVVLGGTTAFDLAIDHRLSSDLPLLILLVLAGSYLVLALVLRSAVLPLKAVLMNLLSISAAYGVLVAVFQWGVLDWTGYQSPGHLDTTVPTLVLAVSFGLSMDYEVYLLTRIRELYDGGASNEQAVASGLATSARTITAAAFVMVGVFGAFAIAGAPVLKELGVGLAVAVGLDATIVRLLIVPAAMRLLGDWNWWPHPGAAAAPVPADRDRPVHATAG